MRARALILLMHTLTLAVPFTAGGAEECDPHLLVRITNPYGYRLRGDRCEGLYVEEVGGAPLLIASWTESFLDYGLHSKQPLEIEWEAPHGTGDIRLRAQGLRRRLYYRMDTVRPFGSTSFAWPSDLLAGIGIPKRDVGVVGVTQVPVSATQREVYLPLRISQGGKVAAQPISYRLVLLPGVELSEVFITMVSAADALLHGSTAGRSRPLAATVYVRRTYSGRPSSSMRFSEAAAMATSVVCRPPVRERSASPITRL